MHNGLIQHDGMKISKSDPRMKDEAFKRTRMIAYLVDTYGAATIRFLLLQGHYRRPSDFAVKHLEAQQTALRRLHKLIAEQMSEAGTADLDSILARQLPTALAQRRNEFVEAMDDDFNSGLALSHLFSLANDVRGMPAGEQQQALALLRDLGRVIGLFLPGDEKDTGQAEGGDDVAGVMADIIKIRATVRANKDFATSDKIRDALTKAGVAIKDNKDGATWELTKKNDNLAADLKKLAGELQAAAK
jgi:cysteinyl-tRNA synthetase